MKALLADAQRGPASGAAGLAAPAGPAEGDLAPHLTLLPIALNSARISDAAAGRELRCTLQGLLDALLGLESVEEDGMGGASAPPDAKLQVAELQRHSSTLHRVTPLVLRELHGYLNFEVAGEGAQKRAKGGTLEMVQALPAAFGAALDAAAQRSKALLEVVLAMHASAQRGADGKPAESAGSL